METTEPSFNLDLASVPKALRLAKTVDDYAALLPWRVALVDA